MKLIKVLFLVFILVFFSHMAFAKGNVAKFNFSTNQFSRLEVIPGIANDIDKFITAGNFTYAFSNSQKAPVSFAYHDGKKWQPAQASNHNFDQITFDADSTRPYVWILDSKSKYQAFFNSSQWFAITMEINKRAAILASQEKSWLVQYDDRDTNSPIKISLFNFHNKTWYPAQILDTQMDHLLAVHAANGNLYLAGIKNTQPILLIHDGKNWRVVDNLPLEKADAIDILVNNDDIVLDAKLANNETLIFSKNAGKIWHEFPISTPLKLYKQTLLNGKFYRFGPSKDYIYFKLIYVDLHAQNLRLYEAQDRNFPYEYRFPYGGLVDASIAPDNKAFCFVRKINSNGAIVPYIGCYNFETAGWRTWWWTDIAGIGEAICI